MPDSAWRASPRAKPVSLRCDGNGLSDAGDESSLISFEELLDCAFGVLCTSRLDLHAHSVPPR
eukprot:4489240-Prymnesium_polylepis.1